MQEGICWFKYLTAEMNIKRLTPVFIKNKKNCFPAWSGEQFFCTKVVDEEILSIN